MSYIQRSLGDGEQVVTLARFHWLYSLRAGLALLVPLVVLAATLVYADEMVREGLAIFAVALFVVGIAVFLTMMIHKWTTEIGTRTVWSEDRLHLAEDREVALPISRASGLAGAVGRVFGFGT
jgi:hypothetical protein